MGLWIKCPGCQGKNPLYASVCHQCGQSLINLSLEQRVYVIDTGAAAVEPATMPARAAAMPEAPAPPPPPPARVEKKPKRPRKKKG
ncbi:MAG: hypothetical protein FJ126_12920 [Deltaproteobacteria bacterium]|nr:hypothetical protein [Deltaproteobacteria bacterium]